MRARSAVLARIAGAVANGEAVDWTAVSTRLSGTREGDVADRLRTLQAVATASSISVEDRAGDARDLPRWLLALFLLVGAQTTLGWAGLLVGGPDAPGSLTWLMVVTAAVYLAAAAALVHQRRLDRRAVWLAAFFLGVASASSQRPLAWLAAAAGGGAWLGSLLPEALLPLFLWRFVRDFPEVVHLSRWSGLVRGGLWLSGSAGGVLLVGNVLATIGGASSAGLNFLSRSGPLHWPLIAALVLGALSVSALRSREASRRERRRAALLLAGVCAGVAPAFVLVLLEETVPAVAALSAGATGRLLTDLIVYVPLLLLPIVASQAVLADEVFGFRTLLRQAVLPATVEYVAVATIGVVGSLLLVHLVVNRHRNVIEVVAQPPAPALLASSVAGVAAMALRRRLVGRRRRLLGSLEGAAVSALARDVAGLRSRTEMLALLAERTSAALDGAAIATWQPAGGDWLCASPERPPLPADGAIGVLVRADPTPLRVHPSDARGVFGWLPAEEREWVVEADLSLVVPVIAGGELAALLGASPVEGRAPSEDAVSLAGALASAVALALRAAPEALSVGDGEAELRASECPACGNVSGREGPCPQCGGPTRDAPIPRELNGRFRVLKVLGRGGMGVVYKALDLGLEREVALKTLPRVQVEALSRFRREALSMARFVHPNLALIFGLEAWRGVPVLVVEYLAGGTLAQRIGPRNPPDTVAAWGLQIVAGLEAMHAEGLLHRDVKPSNVGFTSQGVVKLLDFGLARLVEEIEPSQTRRRVAGEGAVTPGSHLVGTPLYLSPEAWAGEAPCAGHDLWALAIVLWESLTGRHPFGRELRKHPGGCLALRAELPEAPGGMAELLEAALSPEVRERPRSAGEFRRGLESALRS